MADTKQRILEVALDLFSQEGYEAVSVDRIAKAVGIKAPSLYKHYSGKQDIFDAMIRAISEIYEQRSVFLRTDWDDTAIDHSAVAPKDADAAVKMVLTQLQVSIHEPHVVKARHLMMIGQYTNPQLCVMQEQRTYTDIQRFYRGMISYLIRNGVLIEGDAEVMAMQFFSPISMQLYRVDWDPACETEAMELIERHVRQFFAVYGRQG